MSCMMAPGSALQEGWGCGNILYWVGGSTMCGLRYPGAVQTVVEWIVVLTGS